ncbi:MAG: ATP-binding protein [Thiolinea sp.]
MEIRVGDSGCGINTETLPYIFRSVFSRRQDLGIGSGLGLTIVRAFLVPA